MIVFLIAQKFDKSRKAWELNRRRLSANLINFSHLAFARSTRLHPRMQWRSHRPPRGKLSPYISHLLFRSCVKWTIYCINVLRSSSSSSAALQFNILNSLKTRNAVWTVSVRSMVGKIQILARADNVVNGITCCYILIIPLSLLTLSNCWRPHR